MTVNITVIAIGYKIQGVLNNAINVAIQNDTPKYINKRVKPI